MARKKLSVLQETDTGRNIRFKDNYSGKIFTDKQLVNQVKIGNYENYHIRNINGIDTVVSNPDGKKGNNLN